MSREDTIAWLRGKGVEVTENSDGSLTVHGAGKAAMTPRASYPTLCRASTSCLSANIRLSKTWMAGTSPAMTTIVIASASEAIEHSMAALLDCFCLYRLLAMTAYRIRSWQSSAPPLHDTP